MASSIKLSVAMTKGSEDNFKQIGLTLRASEFMKNHEFKATETPMLVEDVVLGIEQYLEELHEERSGGKSKIQVQVQAVYHYKSQVKLDFEDQVSQHLKNRDKVIVEAMALDMSAMPPEFSDKDIEEMRKRLRFGLNDRVLCYCGPRWMSGWIVGTAVPNDEDLLPYLVKTDPLPGLPSSTISVPYDVNEMCIQDVCFDPISQLHLVKAAAAMVSNAKTPKLRFAVGDKVVCRIYNSPQDALEQWVYGVVKEIWPKLTGDLTWKLGEVSGNYPDVVPYKIGVTSGWMYCHRDDHTLIRREGMEPFTRVRGISKRMEVRPLEDGGKESVDHVTERRKRLMNTVLSDSDSE